MASHPLVHSALYGASLLAALHFFFLRPLGEQAEEMHAKQIDPTDIVQIPYDLTRLIYYVSAVGCFALLVVLPTSSTGTKLQNWFLLSLLCFAMMILSGASPTKNVLHTAVAALYWTTLLLCDPPLFSKGPAMPWTVTEELGYRLCGAGLEPQDLVARTVAQVCLAVTVPLQILRLYDRGWQVQRWPVPVIVGSTYGWVLGLWVSTLWAMLKMSRPKGRRIE